MNSCQSNIFVKHLIKSILALLLLGGCATGAIYPITPITVRLSNYNTMLVKVSPEFPYATQEAIQLESMIITKLTKEMLFKNIIAGSSSNTSAELHLSVKVIRVKKVSRSERLVLGAMIGRAGIFVDVELTDLKTGRKIGAFTATGKSSGGTIFAGTTKQAVEYAAKKIVEFVQLNI